MANNAADFARQIDRYVARLNESLEDAIVEIANQVQESVVDGSFITGAPGQPVATGNLKGSWIGEFTSATTWQLTTNVEYAPHVEHNVRGVTFRSQVGGPHSVALTVAGYPLIVQYVALKLLKDFR